LCWLYSWINYAKQSATNPGNKRIHSRNNKKLEIMINKTLRVGLQAPAQGNPIFAKNLLDFLLRIILSIKSPTTQYNFFLDLTDFNAQKSLNSLTRFCTKRAKYSF